MSGIVGQNIGRSSGLVKATSSALGDNSVDSDAYVDASIDTAHIGASQITNALMADNAIGLAEMASGTDGNIISYDASGNPVAIATGSSGQLLQSAGAGAPPTFATVASGGNTPAFAAHSAADQGITDSNYTKVTFGTEIFDSDGTFASSRFTPGVVGKYFIATTLTAKHDADAEKMINLGPCIFVNGSIISSAHRLGSSTHALLNTYSKHHADVVFLDADTDYVEIYAFGQTQTNSPELTVDDSGPGYNPSGIGWGHACTFSGFKIA